MFLPVHAPCTTESWRDKDVASFEAAYKAAGKNFHHIARMLPTKSCKDCVEFYYRWKKTRRGSAMQKPPLSRSVYWDSLKLDEVCLCALARFTRRPTNCCPPRGSQWICPACAGFIVVVRTCTCKLGKRIAQYTCARSTCCQRLPSTLGVSDVPASLEPYMC